MMYCIRKTIPIFDEQEYAQVVSFLTYDGWTEPQHVVHGTLDLKGVILFTEGEAKANELPPNEEFVWYGAYKR